MEDGEVLSASLSTMAPSSQEEPRGPNGKERLRTGRCVAGKKDQSERLCPEPGGRERGREGRGGLGWRAGCVLGEESGFYQLEEFSSKEEEG